MTAARTLLTIGSMIGARRAARVVRRFDLDDLLGAIGLERRSHWSDRILPSLALVAVSAAVGAGAALLLAPSSGADLRRRIYSRAADAKDRFAEKVGEFERQVQAEAGMHG